MTCAWVIRLAVPSVVWFMAAACVLPSSAPSSPDAASLSANLQFCADEINRYRSIAGLPLLTRSSSLENFAAQAVQHDARAGIPHLFFSSGSGERVSRAETELLRWKNYSVRGMLREGLSRMWTAGPSNEHYNVLAGPYSEVGCGLFIDGDEISSAQDFR